MRQHASFVWIAAAAGALLMWPAAAARQLPFTGPAACKHDERSAAPDRARRENALALARAINDAQGRAAEQTRQYQPLAALQNLPPTPQNFQLRLHTDGAGYIFSIKDVSDPCHYGIFSDQEGRLYQMSPQVPQVAS